MAEKEQQLDHFDLDVREKALEKLLRTEALPPRESATEFNLHIHSFFSFNCLGFSPTRIAWEARKHPLLMAGLVDFDVLDGIHEFMRASDQTDIRYLCSLESRVFVSEFSDYVINSPGEPGVAYHMGVGFTDLPSDAESKTFLASMRKGAAERNQNLVDRVNRHMAPLELNLKDDVAPLTPSGNATERHICLAYARKAAAEYANPSDLRAFWADKLGEDEALNALPEGAAFLNFLRAKTMKQGGTGYVKPDGGAFPSMQELNRFTLACGAIPTVAWLNGTTDGEQRMEQWLDIAEADGVEALNIIPDRNFTAGVEDEKVKNLREVVDMAHTRDLPVLVGTEMNSPGNRFVDDFSSAELTPLMPIFLEGAYIAYGHMALQRQARMGYTSDWARDTFSARKEKNQFYGAVGRALTPSTEIRLAGVEPSLSPDRILEQTQMETSA